jgi:Txe/YoeB family toxin of Txe-Axe toxin-antitoxin module
VAMYSSVIKTIEDFQKIDKTENKVELRIFNLLNDNQKQAYLSMIETELIDFELLNNVLAN